MIRNSLNAWRLKPFFSYKTAQIKTISGFPKTKVKVNHYDIRQRTATMEVSHDLLVELEENNICRLKNKLLRYFQSKKSNGGECEVDYKEGDRTAVLRFRREQGEFSLEK